MGENGTSFAAGRQPGPMQQLLQQHRANTAAKSVCSSGAPPSPAEDVPLVDFARLSSALNSRGSSSELSICQRLEKKFGLGRDPKRRRELYKRLEHCVLVHGDSAFEVINDVVHDAVGKEKPGHWFCRAVVSRLRDRKLLGGGTGGDPTW